MARKSFTETVARIKQLDATEGDIAFIMGDETGEQFPIGADSANNGSEKGLKDLADATGVPFETLRSRRFVASRVPPGLRKPGVIWQVYFDIARVKDERKRELMLRMVYDEPPTMIVNGVPRPTKHGRWTIDAVLSHLGEAPRNPPSGSKELLERAFREAPPEVVAEVIAEVVEDKPKRKAVYEGLHKHEQKETKETERKKQSEPALVKLDQQAALTDLTEACDKFAEAVANIMPRLGEVPSEDARGLDLGANFFLRTSLEGAREALRRVENFFSQGKSDLDKFIGSVLKEGQ